MFFNAKNLIQKPKGGVNRTSVVALGVAMAFGLSGCIIVQGPQPDAPPRPTVTVTVPDPEFVAGGSAEENKDYFVLKLTQFVKSDEDITAQKLVDALADAGFEKDLMQVTADETKTGLDTDFISVSVLFEDRCLVGQVVKKKRELFVEEVAAIGAEQNVCIIGQTIDF